MRTVVAACLIFAGARCLSAQPDVPRDQCLGGTLIGATADSVTLRFNQKINTYRLTADAEIWRRGRDLKGTTELSAGDEIYLVCAREPGTGAVVASVIAAAQTEDSIQLVPHNIVEYRVCGGRLVKIAREQLWLNSGDGLCVVKVRPGTEIWRGELFPDTGALKIGDEVMSRAMVSYPSEDLIAENVEANVVKAEGIVIAARPDRIEVKQDRVRGHVTVLIDSRTQTDGASHALRKGDFVLAIGLDLGHRTFRATSIQIEGH